jgi:hypothetical protein
MMEKTPCPECSAAEITPASPVYRAGCLECSTRHLAHLPSHWTSRAARRIMPSYRSALEAVFGDSWEAGHMRVKAWADRIESARLQAAHPADEVVS